MSITTEDNTVVRIIGSEHCFLAHLLKEAGNITTTTPKTSNTLSIKVPKLWELSFSCLSWKLWDFWIFFNFFPGQITKKPYLYWKKWLH